MQHDSFGIIVATLFLTLAISILPLLIIQNHVDSMAGSAANEAVEQFVDNARSTGYISKADFDVLRAKLASTGYAYHIAMLHQSTHAVPDPSNALGYRISSNAYNFEDIEQAWYSNDVYTMKNGDFFEIEVVSVTPTRGSQIYGALFGGSGNKAVYTAGGMVGNSLE